MFPPRRRREEIWRRKFRDIFGSAGAVAAGKDWISVLRHRDADEAGRPADVH
jgi:hypothetical protein